MSPKRDKHHVNGEPHLNGSGFQPDPSEDRADRAFAPRAQYNDEDVAVDQNVWDEPATSPALTASVPDQYNYADWLMWRRSKTSLAKSWAITLVVILAAGPLAILGALVSGHGGQSFPVLAIVLFGPLIEELMKIILPLWIVEKRPYLFRSRSQILICAIAGAVVFAAVENLIYFNIYVDDPTPGFIYFRWTVCVALHTGCSVIASLGVMRIWARIHTTGQQPQIALATPLLIAAVVVHGSYNAFAIILSLTDFHF